MGAARYKVVGAALAALILTLVSATAASAAPPSEIVIPAGDVATLSNATFGGIGNCPADRLEYGYELGWGANVQLASGVGCEPASGGTIGPFARPTQLRIYLDDFACGDTFYSDGDHALVSASSPWSWSVAMMDANICTSAPGDPRVPAQPGAGNFNVTVTLTPATPQAVCATTRALAGVSENYGNASPFSPRGYATVWADAACIAIDQVSAWPSPQNASLIAQYDGYLAILVQDGWLTTADGSYLAAAAGAL